MRQKEKLLQRLDDERLLELAKPLASIEISKETSRSVLINVVRESLSIGEIRKRVNAIKVENRQRRRPMLVLIAVTTIIIFSLIPMTIAVNSSLPTRTTPPEEQWNRTYGSSSVNATSGANYIQQTSDGGYIIAGYTGRYDSGYIGFWLVKVNQDGKVQWNKTFGGDYWGQAYSVQQTSDGGYIIAGVSDNYLVKVGANGSLQWNRTNDGIAYDFAYSVQQTSDGGYIVGGQGWLFNESTGESRIRALLIKTNSNGAEVWNMTYGGVGASDAESVLQTSDGGYIFAGYTVRTHSGFDQDVAWLVRTDQYGNSLWNRTYMGRSIGYAFCVEQTSDAGYIIGGQCDSTSMGLVAAWLIKTDSNGIALWNMTYGGHFLSSVYSVHQTIDGGYVLAGYESGLYGNESVCWILKTDQDGMALWNKTLSGDGFASARCVQLTSDGGYVVAGTTSRSYNGPYSDILIAKLREPTLSIPTLVHVIVVVDIVLCATCMTLVKKRKTPSNM